MRIARVVPEARTACVLTVERLRGLKVDDLAGLDAVGVDRAAIDDGPRWPC